MSIVDQLKDIRKKQRSGDIKAISDITGLNRGLVSNYLVNAHRMVLKRYIAEKIISGYEKIKN